MRLDSRHLPAILCPMPVPVLYLDTSVIGGYFDDERKDATQELWRQMEQGRFRFLSSERHHPGNRGRSREPARSF